MNPNPKEQLAILGYGLRFPGAETPEQLWRLLVEGRDAIGPIPVERLPRHYRHARSDVPGKSASAQAGLLADIAAFDAGYFGISPREARLIDPHQRLLLELCVEALERAGLPTASLAGRKVGVFVAMVGGLYAPHVADAEVDIFTATGSDSAIGANRISYALDLTGPSLTVNTACSSALTAFHHGCQAVRSGEAEMAIVAAANLIIDPQFHLMLSKAMLLAPDGRCRSFDASGSGYVRAEGAAAFVIKRLDAAEADGDPIRAVVLATGTNADGHTAGLSLPNGAAQEALLEEVYARAGIDRAEVCYVEAHGTGTAAGDPIECGAIGRVLGLAHAPERPLLIGSIKSNIGHMETAAGFGGLAKALLVLQHGAVPRSLHFVTPNPAIDFSGQNLRVVTELTAIPRDEAAVIGISSFGFGGANAHVVVRGPAPPPPASLAAAADDPAVLCLPVTARSAEALGVAIDRMRRFLDERQDLDLGDIVHTALRRRDLHRHRAIVVGADRAALSAGLAEAAAGPAATVPPGIRAAVGLGTAAETGKRVFLFTGNGPQWHAMGRELLAESPRYRARFEAIDAGFRARSGIGLIEELELGEARSRIARTEIAQPLLFALQLALVDHLAGLGIRPDAVIGHSVGEVAAAHVAGALDLEAAIRVIHARSRWQGATAGTGQMAAIGMSAPDAAAWLAPRAPDVVVAAANGPQSATLAGPADALDRLEPEAERAGLFFRRLRLDYAFHSPAMDPIRAPLADALAGLKPGAARLPFISTVSGAPVSGEALDADYWWRNVRDPVRFHDGVTWLTEAGYRNFIEIGPHPALCGYVTEALGASGRAGHVFETLRRRTAERLATHRLLARCLAVGVPVDLAALSSRGTVVDLPTYPWQHEPYWATGLLAEGDECHPLLGRPLRAGLFHWESEISQRSHAYLADHVFADEVILPTTAYLELAQAAGREIFGPKGTDIVDFEILAMLVVPRERPLRLATEVQADGALTIRSRPLDEPSLPWTLHAAGRLVEAETSTPQWIEAPAEAAGATLEGAAFYEKLDGTGFHYGPSFRLLRTLRDAGAWSIGELVDADTRAAHLEPESGYLWHPALMDVALQLPLFSLFGRGVETGPEAFLPVAIKRVSIPGSARDVARVFAAVRRPTPHSVEADMLYMSADGRLLARLDGYRARRVSRSAQAGPVGGLHRYRWVLQESRRRLPPLRLAPLLGQSHAATVSSVPAAGLAHFDRLCGAVAADVLLRVAGAGPFDLDEFAAAGEIDEACVPFARRLAAMAAADGLADAVADGWRITAATPDLVEAAWRSAVAEAPEAFAEIELVREIGAALPDLLRGALDPETLLSSGRIALLLERALRTGPIAGAARQTILATIEATIRVWPADKRLRILELGAERSALTTALLPLLPLARTDYVLSDADPDWLEFARIRHERHGVATLVADPGLPADLARIAGPFDLILANDTLQEATERGETLARLRALLAENGILLLDMAHPGRFATLVFGLMRGLRTEAGGMAREPWTAPGGWSALLGGAGYAEVAEQPIGIGGEVQRSIVVARNPAPPAAEPMRRPDSPGRAILLLAPGAQSDFAGALRIALTDRGIVVAERAYEPGRAAGPAETWRAMLARLRSAPDEIVFVAPAGDPDAAPPADFYAPLLGLAQALGTDAAARLTIVTQAGFPVAGSPGPIDPGQALYWGFARSLGNELPNLRCRRIDLQGGTAAAARLAEVIAGAGPDDEDELLLTPFARYAHRLEFIADAALPEAREGEPAAHVALSFAAQGSLHNLAWHRIVPRPPAAGEVQVAVRASGLNFKDVLLVLGLLPSEWLKAGAAGPAVGLECAGEIAAVGGGVAGFEPGDRVVVFGAGSFATTLNVDARFVVRLAARLGFEDGASMPTVFATAWHALHHLARLDAGETVLIHGAAGGVGQAAIQIAHAKGATVFATAGSEEKRAFLRRSGVAHVLDSRSLAFAEAIRRLTQGEGVDVALNALAGEAMLATLGTLKPFGRFLEIGKRDLIENRKVGLRNFIDNISYHAIDLDQLFTHRPKVLTGLMRDVMALAAEGTIRPIPRQVYPATAVAAAFGEMQASHHIGKLVVTYPAVPRGAIRGRAGAAPLRLAADETHLVTGGTRGFGLLVARWLAARGARCLVLAGLTGELGPEGRRGVADLEAAGVRVVVAKADIACAAEAERLIALPGLPPLAGVFHAAVTYWDRTVLSASLGEWDAVVATKARGAWLLDQLTRALPLNHFVMFSSIAATVGSEGQAAYAAANLYLEALVDARRARHLPGLAVNWGAIADVGAVQRDAQLRQRMVGGTGLALLPAREGLIMLERAMLAEAAHIGIGGLPGKAMASWHRDRPSPRLEAALAVMRRDTGEDRPDGAAAGSDWRAAPTPEERRNRFETYVLAIVRETLGYGSKPLDTTLTLGDIGADSLVALQLVRTLERHLDARFPDVRALQTSSIAALIELLHARLPLKT